MLHAALLRAVNLPRHQKVGMAALRELLEGLGLEEVRTLLQSGNVVFRSEAKKKEALEQLLEEASANRLGLKTDFFVRTAKDWKRIVDANPFPDVAKDDPSHLVVLFLKDAVKEATVADLQKTIRDREQVRGKGREVYLVYPDGIGRSRLTMATIERKLGTRGTGRNWSTIRKLGALVGACAIACTILCLASTQALADRWMPPGETSYFSRGGEFRLTVLPRVLSDAGDYWHDKTAGSRKPGQAFGERDVCLGRLARRATDGSFTVVWSRELVNEVSPVSALVARDGRHVVTFDNWHSMGYGKNAVVIYGPDGELKASFGLSDFLTREQMAELSRSSSSLHWGGVHRFDAREERLVLEVVGRPDERNVQQPWLNVSISLASPRDDIEVTKAEDRSGVDVLFQVRPEVDWIPESKLRADLDCDGHPDQAVLGRAGGRSYVGVVSARRARPEVLEVCGEPAVLSLEERKGCKGLRLQGGDCDGIRLFWGRGANGLTWTRR